MPFDKKPVYIPRQKRLHGAFRGGFSAGYFNTVGSREGWTPRQHVDDDDDELQQQRPEDFMDEQDHNEWGGPSAVNAAFQLGGGEIREPTLALLSGAAVVPPVNIGRQLLRALGWRESSSSAFVPSKNTLGSDNNKNHEEQLYLSARRLKKIRLSQVKVEIPQPKLDTAGLGFQRFANAPEFQRDREKRRKLQANHRQKVYRVADAMGPKEPSTRPKRNDDDDDHYVSFETENDFVGSKSVGGFALHEDEDDAYDDDEENLNNVTGRVKLDQDYYDNVAYEHLSSSDEENQEVSSERKSQGSKGVAAVLGSVLSAWASTSAPEDGAKKQVLTSDGRPVLSGFVLGGTDSSFASSQRYPGPDLPDGYEVEPHVFSVEDHPRVIQALSHAEKLAASTEQKMAIVEKALKSNAVVNQPARLHQKGIFEGVRTDMSSRFVSSESTMETQSNVPVAGLSTAAEFVASRPLSGSTEATENSPRKDLTITRSVSMFVPEPLLCKRFHVSPPEHTAFTLAAAPPTESRTREEAYFQDEILAKVKVAPSNETTSTLTGGEEKGLDGLDGNARPSMEVYKAIFDVQESPDSTEDENDGDTDEAHLTLNYGSNVDSSLDEAMPTTREERIVSYEERKRSHPRSPSSPEEEDFSDRSDNKRRRKREDKASKKRRKDDDRKRRKKHKKSSKRKRDRDGHED